MPLDFPSSPANGAIYDQYVYDSALPGWRSKGGAVAATYTSDTAPSGAVKGDMWYRTSDGTTFVYVVDANTSQWVEIRSEISTAQVGLVPVVPTSISVGAGSASVSTSGLITVTGVSSLSLNNVFTSSYRNYKIVAKFLPASGSVITAFRFRASGSDISTASYSNQGTIITGGSIAPINNVGLTSLNCIVGYGTVPSGLYMDFLAPQVAEGKAFSALSNGHNGSALTYISFSGYWGATAQFDGISIIPSASTLTGTMQVYGYN